MRVRKKQVEVDAVRFIHIQAGHIVTDRFTWGGDTAPEWFLKALTMPMGEGAIWLADDRVYVGTDKGIVTAEDGDWIIRGTAGEIYPCSPDIFDGIYEPSTIEVTHTPFHSFSLALDLLKNHGRRIARQGWNGKGMWLIYVPAWQLVSAPEPVLGLELRPFIGMKTADDQFVPWVASQTDMLADDWVILDAP